VDAADGVISREPYGKAMMWSQRTNGKRTERCSCSRKRLPISRRLAYRWVRHPLCTVDITLFAALGLCNRVGCCDSFAIARYPRRRASIGGKVRRPISCVH